jgi:hypothetical protein
MNSGGHIVYCTFYTMYLPLCLYRELPQHHLERTTLKIQILQLRKSFFFRLSFAFLFRYISWASSMHVVQMNNGALCSRASASWTRCVDVGSRLREGQIKQIWNRFQRTWWTILVGRSFSSPGMNTVWPPLNFTVFLSSIGAATLYEFWPSQHFYTLFLHP